MSKWPKLKSFFQRDQLTSPSAIAMIVMSVGLISTFSLVLIDRRLTLDQQELLATDHVHRVSSSVEKAFYKRLSLSVSLEAFVKSHPYLDWSDTEDQKVIKNKFEIFTTSLEEQVPGIVGIQLAPNGVNTNFTHINRQTQTIEHDIFKNHNQSSQVIENNQTGDIFVEEPLTLLPGEDAIIIHNAIFNKVGALKPQQYISQNHSEPNTSWLKDLPSDYWGISTVVIDRQKLFQEAGIINSKGIYQYSIKGKNGLGEAEEIFWGDESIFDNPLVTTTISLPTGEWTVGTQLISGLSEWRSFWIFILGVDVSGMLGYSAFARKKTEQKLKKTNKELLCATQLKDEFLANMSHELRTPLNAILGTTEGLQEEIFGLINAQQHKQLQTIEHSGHHLLSLINDILDVAKIEAGQMDIKLQATNLNSLIQSCLALITSQAQKKNIQLKTCPLEQLPNVLIDERRIRQALVNLLHNAVKFTAEEGVITLKIDLIETALIDNSENEMSPYHLNIAVTDTGIGIAPEDQKKLFQPFIQIDSTLNRQYDGTGLGLALVKRIIELHSGEIKVSSKVGVGSCFTVDIPCSIEISSSPQQALQLPSTSNTAQINHSENNTAKMSSLILLVEDNQANIFTISSYLKAKGYHLVSAKTGKEAIALIQSKQPDLILMDIQMPQMDGIETIQYIRKDLKMIKIPIIALTALAMPGDRKRCIEAGATDYISKPIKLKLLQSSIQKYLTA